MTNESTLGEQRLGLARRGGNISQLPRWRLGSTRALGDYLDACACPDERARCSVRQILSSGQSGILQYVRLSIQVARHPSELALLERNCAPMGRVGAGYHSRQQAEPRGWP